MNKHSLLIVVVIGVVFVSGGVRADDIYVTNPSRSLIEEFAPDGTGSIFASDHSLYGVEGLAFDQAGNLYAAVEGNGIEGSPVEEFTPAGIESTFANLEASSVPDGVAFDQAGNLYVADNYGNQIFEITPNGAVSIFADCKTPTGLAFDSKGDLYVADAHDGTIEKFTPNGVGSIFASLGQYSGPSGLAFDGAGNLYVDTDYNTIEELTPDGICSIFASASGNDSVLGGTSGLAFDSAGNLYANNSDSTIEKFTPDGVGSVFASISPVLGAGGSIAIQPGLPVPEPALLMPLGFGAMGLLMRRRRG
jgi:sugar lactone lactonase YvrE